MNDNLFLLINHLAGRNWLLDDTMVFAARGLLWILIAGSLAFLALKRKRQGVFFVVVTLLLAAAGSWFLEYWTSLPRPIYSGTARLLISTPPTYSFPSTHTALAFAAAGTVFLYQRFLGFIGIITAFLIGVSRIFVGVHYPEDIIVGAFWGLFSSVSSYFIFKKLTYFIGR